MHVQVDNRICSGPVFNNAFASSYLESVDKVHQAL
jgi:hypothetical protein